MERRDTAVMNIVLLEPEMPSNTGNIGRACIATKTRLHLIEPPEFRLNEKALKGVELDYWDKLDVIVHSDYQDFLKRNLDALGCMYFATTKAHKAYFNVEYEPGHYLMFGKESAGIPEEILVENEEHCTRIPMRGDIHSLNLSNLVSVVLYGALWQHGFEKMAPTGQLHHLNRNHQDIQGRLRTLRFIAQGGGLFLWWHGSYSSGWRTFTDPVIGAVCALGNIKHSLMEGTMSVMLRKAQEA